MNIDNVIRDYRKDFVITERMNFVVDPVAVFPEVENLLYGVAWEFARSYPISFEECRSVAFAAFLKACTDYNDKRKMKFSSWARYWAWCKLKDLVMKRSGERVSFTDDIGEDTLTVNPPLDSPALDMVRELGDDAKTIVHLFLEVPFDLFGANTVQQLVKRTKEFLVKKKNWEPSRFDITFEQVRMQLQTVWAK